MSKRKKPLPLKDGRPSQQEIDFIARNHKVMGIDEMAAALNRSEKVVSTLVKKIQGEQGDGTGDKTRFILKRRSFYKQLQQQLSVEELDKFEEEWNSFIKQFKYDILPTEEYQLISAITSSIMIDRCLIERKRWLDDMERIEGELSLLYEMPLDIRDPEHNQRILQLEQEKESLRASFQYNSKERIEIEKQREAYMKSLKGTRDQRIDKSTDIAATWPDLVTKLYQKDQQEQLTKEAGLLHLAAQKEKERLGQYHTYQDGMVDKPILNSETVEDGNGTTI